MSKKSYLKCIIKFTWKHLKKKLGSIKWNDFSELQTNKIENMNVEIENLLSNVEDTFINTAGKVF